EDGIRDRNVTGVQTCALPICHRDGRDARRRGDARHRGRDPMRGAGRLALAAAVLLGGTLAPALAEDEVIPLQGDIIDLDEGVVPLEGEIQPLERTRTDGGVTEITLSTDILFATGSSEISGTAAARVVDLVQDVPRGAEVSIDGHTDSVPYRRGNQVLSEERAEAVAAPIREARPDLDLTVTGHGDSEPVADEGQGDPDARAQNRRVEIRYDG